MSFVGFDLGNERCIVVGCRVREVGLRLLGNTRSAVCFGDKQRFIGASLSAKNTIYQIERLIGRSFSDPILQSDLRSLPFTVTEGPDGFPLVQVEYLGEQRTFTPTQILAMVLSKLKGIAEKNLHAEVTDCCIGIPVYFTDIQRRAVLDAATIAGLHPLRLFHETTAAALAYKSFVTKDHQFNAAFVDVGHASLQVCIVGFNMGPLKILAHSFDESLGGRDFDEALFEHFAKKFKEEYKVNVHENACACFRLRAACEKLKKELSVDHEALLNIERLMDEKDVKGVIKRNEFERISAPILERIKGPLHNALSEAKLDVQSIHLVVRVGSGSHVPAIIRLLTEFFGKEPKTTVDCPVAIGCTRQCATLSCMFRAPQFQVHESFPFSIALSWKGPALGSQNGTADNQEQSVIFPKGSPIPSIKVITFYRASTFAVDVMYADVSNLHPLPKISTYTIGPFHSVTGQPAKLKVKVQLNIHGIVSVDSAAMFEEEVEVRVSYKNESRFDSSMGQDEVNLQDNKITTGSAGGAKNGAPQPEGKTVQMQTDVKTTALKQKVKETNVSVMEMVYGGTLAEDLKKAVDHEIEMVLHDRVMGETKDMKNAVEAYADDMQKNVITEGAEVEARLREKALPKYATPVMSAAHVKRTVEAPDRNIDGKRRRNMMPCAACKHRCRKCDPSCILAPYFPSNHPKSWENFQMVYDIFFNVEKRVRDVALENRGEMVECLVSEAKARIKDPVRGVQAEMEDLSAQISERKAHLKYLTLKLKIMRELELKRDMTK